MPGIEEISQLDAVSSATNLRVPLSQIVDVIDETGVAEDLPAKPPTVHHGEMRHGFRGCCQASRAAVRPKLTEDGGGMAAGLSLPIRRRVRRADEGFRFGGAGLAGFAGGHLPGPRVAVQ